MKYFLGKKKSFASNSLLKSYLKLSGQTASSTQKRS